MTSLCVEDFPPVSPPEQRRHALASSIRTPSTFPPPSAFPCLCLTLVQEDPILSFSCQARRAKLNPLTRRLRKAEMGCDRAIPPCFSKERAARSVAVSRSHCGEDGRGKRNSRALHNKDQKSERERERRGRGEGLVVALREKDEAIKRDTTRAN